ncbi:MAG: hypothetical protein Kow00103_12200 [Candidatus Caldatribacteriota bacterium]
MTLLLINILSLTMINAIGTCLFFVVIASSIEGIKYYLIGDVLVKIVIIIGWLSFKGNLLPLNPSGIK